MNFILHTVLLMKIRGLKFHQSKIVITLLTGFYKLAWSDMIDSTQESWHFQLYRRVSALILESGISLY